MDLKTQGRKSAGYIKPAACLLFLLLAAPGAGPARADDISPGKAESVAATVPASVRDIIAQQLQAIHDRDGGRAFALASADFHGKFGTAQKFMNHLRFTCRAIYDFDTFRFLDGHIVNGALVQKVEIRPHYLAHPITALFRVEQQADGQWLIDSFTVLDDDSQPV